MFVGVDQLFIVLLRIFLVITFIDKTTYPVSTLDTLYTKQLHVQLKIMHVFYQWDNIIWSCCIRLIK